MNSEEGKEKLWQLTKLYKTHSKHWCPIVSSKEIKKVIINRCDNLGVSVQEVCLSCGFNDEVLTKEWLNNNEPLSVPTIRAEAIIAIGKKIGIEIRTIVVVKDIEKYSRKEILNKLKA